MALGTPTNYPSNYPASQPLSASSTGIGGSRVIDLGQGRSITFTVETDPNKPNYGSVISIEEVQNNYTGAGQITSNVLKTIDPYSPEGQALLKPGTPGSAYGDFRNKYNEVVKYLNANKSKSGAVADLSTLGSNDNVPTAPQATTTKAQQSVAGQQIIDDQTRTQAIQDGFGIPTDPTIESTARSLTSLGPLKYPIDALYDVGIDPQEHTLFTIFEYQGAGVTDFTSAFSAGRRLNEVERRKTFINSIRLPIPTSVNDQNGVSWGDANLDALSAMVMGGLSGSMNSLMNLNPATAIQTIVQTVQSAIGAVSDPGLKRVLADKLAASVAGQLGINVDPAQFLTRSTGVAIDTNLELLFKSPTLRTFSFSYRLSPRSQKEAIQVRSIIRSFKEAMAPRRGVTLRAGANVTTNAPAQSVAIPSNFIIGTPLVFGISYRRGNTNIAGLNKIKTCALTNMSVDYTGGQGRFVSYKDSQPMTVIMNLSFKELKPIYNTDYLEFDGLDDVGY